MLCFLHIANCGKRQQTEKARFSRILEKIRCNLVAECKSMRSASLTTQTQQSPLVHPEVTMRRNIFCHLKQARDNRHCSEIASGSTQDMNGDPAGGLQHASCCFAWIFCGRFTIHHV